MRMRACVFVRLTLSLYVSLSLSMRMRVPVCVRLTLSLYVSLSLPMRLYIRARVSACF